MYHVARELSVEFEVALVGPRGAADHMAGTVYSCPPAPLTRFLPCCVRKTWIARRSLHPDLVFAGSGLTALPAELAARGTPRIAYVHGLDLVAPDRLYQRLFIPALRRCQTVIANSTHTRRLAQDHGVPEARIALLHPGVSLPKAGSPETRRRARLALGISETTPVLLSVGRLTRRKGVLEFIERVLPSVIARFPETLCLIIGGDPEGAVRGHAMGESIGAAVDRMGLADRVRLLGTVDEDRLETAYRAADLHVFPCQERREDVEGFGMVAVEAAAYGLPTLAFAVGGVADAVAHETSGWLVASGDYSGFTGVLLDYLSGGRTIDAVRCAAFAREFSWLSFGVRLRGICSDAIERARSASSSRSASL